MSDFDDSFWNKPKRPKHEVVADALSRLTFGSVAEPPKREGPRDVTEDERRAFYERQDQMFSGGYVEIAGAAAPLSKELARKLGYEVDRLPGTRHTAGDDPEARDD